MEIAGHVVKIPHRGHGPGEVTVAIRPDAIALHAGDGGRGIAGRISRSAFVGHAVEYVVETTAGELLAIVPPDGRTFTTGERVSVALSGRGVALVE